MYGRFVTLYHLPLPTLLCKVTQGMKEMATKFPYSLLLILLFFFSISSSSPTSQDILHRGSSLSVEKNNDVLVSPDGTFTAGFYQVGDNAYAFAIWFTNGNNPTVAWMANRDYPVNGKASTLSLQHNGDLVLRDAGRFTIWSTNTTSIATDNITLNLLNTGNLILRVQTSKNQEILWQSFDFPTDALLPGQLLTKNAKLVSSRSRGNYSSGFYSFYFDNDNVLRLLYNGPQISSVYWPNPGAVSWEVGRTTYNSSRIAVFNSSGSFVSSDDLRFFASDYGIGPMRRLVMDFDGNLRLYSLDPAVNSWVVSWQGISNPCSIHGVCGPYGICISTAPRRQCSCPPGYRVQDPTDWSLGCYPTFNLSCDAPPFQSKFIEIPHVDYYGYDFNYTTSITQQACESICLELCNCKAYMYMLDGQGRCYPKTLLLNGIQSPSFLGIMHLRIPNMIDDQNMEGMGLKCSDNATIDLPREFESKNKNSSLKYLRWFVYAMGGSEIICVVLGWWYLFRKRGYSDPVNQGYYLQAVSGGSRQFSYQELKKATKNFSEEIGRGGAGAVYKAVFPDHRVAAVKKLEGVLNQGEAEFLAEVSTIGKINHMNLIQMWGFCAEGKLRILVYEYMENGSLAENLASGSCDWEKRFEIAVGTAKGLAYLHEECLEWVIHCDVKPQNILLDKHFQPKVSDFGLSKLRDRGHVNAGSGFSRVRGTRGYMAPEWIMNLPITSKVDVYSYGIVVLEMVTGKSSTGFQLVDDGAGEIQEGRLVPWVRNKMASSVTVEAAIEELVDPAIGRNHDMVKMEALITVGLQCVEEDKDMRPTMRQVVEMLLAIETQPQTTPLEPG